MLGSYKSICLASPVKPSLALYSPLLLRIARPVCGYGLWQGIWPLPEEIRPSTSPLQGPHTQHTHPGHPLMSGQQQASTLSACCRCRDYACWVKVTVMSLYIWCPHLYPSFTYCIISWPTIWRGSGTLFNLQSGQGW